jgi:RNA polymerase sigma-70 factor (ECF subfamily)
MLWICFRYSRSIAEAEDVLQDAFIRIFQYLPTFKKEGSLEGWVRKIVVNTALNNIKKNKHVYNELEIDTAKGVESELESTVENYDSKLIWETMNQLPEGYRIILNMYAIEGYSHKEIAEHLNIAEGTSRSQFLRAKVQLQKLLLKHEIFIKH